MPRARTHSACRPEKHVVQRALPSACRKSVDCFFLATETQSDPGPALLPERAAMASAVGVGLAEVRGSTHEPNHQCREKMQARPGTCSAWMFTGLTCDIAGSLRLYVPHRHQRPRSVHTWCSLPCSGHSRRLGAISAPQLPFSLLLAALCLVSILGHAAAFEQAAAAKNRRDCVDQHESCAAWASGGECMANPAGMAPVCRASCAICESDKLHDTNLTCPFWASSGDCETNPAFMSKSCAFSCARRKYALTGIPRNADGTVRMANAVEMAICVDVVEDCPNWAAQGSCTSNAAYTAVSCMASCALCQSEKLHDQQVNCTSWAETGECVRNPSFMNTTCAWSCKRATLYGTSAADTATASSSISASSETLPATSEKVAEASKELPDIFQDVPNASATDAAKPCADQQEHCADWARSGECTRNPTFMHPTCPASCELCEGRLTQTFATLVAPTQKTAEPSGCKDVHVDCAAWAKHGECEANAVFMEKECKFSCGLCDEQQEEAGQGEPGDAAVAQADSAALPCKDLDAKCEMWANRGECTGNAANHDFMTENCKLSCGLCATAEASANLVESSQSNLVESSQSNLVESSQSNLVESSQSASPLRDTKPGCPSWAKRGECDYNAEFMQRECALSCAAQKVYDMAASVGSPGESASSPEVRSGAVGALDGEIATSAQLASCVDWAENGCAKRARLGECESDPVARFACPASCGLCQSEALHDSDAGCVGWAKAGECVNNEVFMLETCRFSCRESLPCEKGGKCAPQTKGDTDGDGGDATAAGGEGGEDGAGGGSEGGAGGDGDGGGGGVLDAGDGKLVAEERDLDDRGGVQEGEEEGIGADADADAAVDGDGDVDWDRLRQKRRGGVGDRDGDGDGGADGDGVRGGHAEGRRRVSWLNDFSFRHRRVRGGDQETVVTLHFETLLTMVALNSSLCLCIAAAIAYVYVRHKRNARVLDVANTGAAPHVLRRRLKTAHQSDVDFTDTEIACAARMATKAARRT